MFWIVVIEIDQICSNHREVPGPFFFFFFAKTTFRKQSLCRRQARLIDSGLRPWYFPPNVDPRWAWLPRIKIKTAFPWTKVTCTNPHEICNVIGLGWGFQFKGFPTAWWPFSGNLNRECLKRCSTFMSDNLDKANKKDKRGPSSK